MLVQFTSLVLQLLLSLSAFLITDATNIQQLCSIFEYIDFSVLRDTLRIQTP